MNKKQISFISWSIIRSIDRYCLFSRSSKRQDSEDMSVETYLMRRRCDVGILLYKLLLCFSMNFGPTSWSLAFAFESRITWLVRYQQFGTVMKYNVVFREFALTYIFEGLLEASPYCRYLRRCWFHRMRCKAQWWVTSVIDKWNQAIENCNSRHISSIV